MWTLADPERVPAIIQAYRGACDDAGREPGEIILQAGVSWAADDDRALEGARAWKGAQPIEYHRDDWHDPARMYAHAEETITDGELRDALIIAADPEVHVERIREVEQMGATIVMVANFSGADPLGAIARYRDHVLPSLRGTRG